MHNKSPAFFRAFISALCLALSLLLFAGCNSSSSVPLAGPASTPPSPGDEKPNPTPTPNSPPDTGTPPGAGGPSPTPVPPNNRVARIYCMPGAVNGNQTLSTLTADAVEGYISANIGFFLQDGTRAEGVKFPTALKSDGRNGTVILKAQFGDHSSPWKIYKATVDFQKERGNLALVSSYAGEPNGLPYVKENLNLPLKMTDANSSRTAFVYPNDKGNYIVETYDGSKTLLPVSAERHGNPRFVRDTWVLFDQVTSAYKVTQKFYSLKSGKATSLPAPDESRDYQLFGHITPQGTFFWIEGRPGATWKLKSMTGLRTTTVVTLPSMSAALRLPVVFFEDQGQVHLAYLEEAISTDQNGLFFTEKGLLHVLAVTPNLKVREVKSADYSQRLKDMIVRPKVGMGKLMPELLNALFYEPISGHFYASIAGQAGLASFDLSKDTWSLHSLSYTCLNPHSGIEETHE